MIELLVVVAIIAVLVAVLLPALAAAREKTRQTVCASHLQQMGVASVFYGDEFDGWLPKLWAVEQTWYTGLGRYLGGDGGSHQNSGAFNCPSTLDLMNAHYGRNIDVTYWSYYPSAPHSTAEFWNRAGAHVKLGGVRYPDKTAYLCDRTDWWLCGIYWVGFNYVHSGKLNMLYADVHVGGATMDEADYRVRIVRYVESNW